MGRRDLVVKDNKNRDKNLPFDIEDHDKLYRVIVKQIKKSGKTQKQAEAVADVLIGKVPGTRTRREFESSLVSIFNDFPKKESGKNLFAKLGEFIKNF